jgi:aliphatic nitrilase
MDKPMFDFLVKRDRSVANVLEKTPGAESFFVNPTGTQFGDTLQTEEGLIYAELDLSQCIEPKQFHDVVGYYNRFDVFDLKVNRKRIEPITWVNLADDTPN